jgi:hypothetical protein
VDERIQPERVSAVPSGKPTIFSSCNLASSHLMYSQVCHEIQTPVGWPSLPHSFPRRGLLAEADQTRWHVIPTAWLGGC